MNRYHEESYFDGDYIMSHGGAWPTRVVGESYFDGDYIMSHNGEWPRRVISDPNIISEFRTEKALQGLPPGERERVKQLMDEQERADQESGYNYYVHGIGEPPVVKNPDAVSMAQNDTNELKDTAVTKSSPVKSIQFSKAPVTNNKDTTQPSATKAKANNRKRTKRYCPFM